MATLDEIVTAIKAVDARREGLKARIIDQGDTSLKEGTWHGRRGARAPRRPCQWCRTGCPTRPRHAGRQGARCPTHDRRDQCRPGRRTFLEERRGTARRNRARARGRRGCDYDTGRCDPERDTASELPPWRRSRQRHDAAWRPRPRQQSHRSDRSPLPPNAGGEALRPSEAAAIAAWAAMVDADAEQVARIREPEPAGDYYAPTAPRFRPGVRPLPELPPVRARAEASDT